MRAENAKAFLGQHTHNGCEQPVITAKGRAADARHNPHTFGIGAEIQKRRPPHRPDKHQILHALCAQQGQNLTGRAQSCCCMRVWREHAGLGKPFEADKEHRPPGCLGGLRDLARQWAAAGENAEAGRCHSEKTGSDRFVIPGLDID
jgi:hypothetical protein